MQNVNSETMRLNYVESRKEWRMAKGMGHAQGPGNYPELTVQPNHSGKFTFKIQNPDGVTFAKIPFVAKTGKTNPGDFKHQFSWTGEGTDTLVVAVKNTNANGGPYAGGVYHYELQFNNAPPLDPIISNLGCCQRISGDGGNLAAYSLGAVGILALGVVAYKLFWR